MSVNLAIADLARLPAGFLGRELSGAFWCQPRQALRCGSYAAPLRSNLETGLSFVCEDELQDERF